ncbi:redox protein [Marivirga tractuosa]|uniref:OsmC family protein n=1 Tax=Marivirga tractuosa (strain ATCC 23168 / DSM 4126 / NBRC 15989 / NCIMB 1408 / VKM B-1430 / H-43) TaxID=643867 RepID=E4TRU1_MARTH|nr:OsmC family protein [Marivirga tractuosa]ADR22790.1 OsmC family protein [Marivirga tractuosa DSM 4126]BDD16539.1 redox protein [Marivirga tractuosa]
MITSSIKYIHPLKTNATHNRSGNSLITDAPIDNNGEGAYFSPTDLAATSLASCMLTVMGIYADQNNLELGEIKCDLQKEMAANPRRIKVITINIDWKTNLPENEIQKLKNVALNCPVSKSLHPEIEQNISFKML